ncbi:alpha/beta fold hydrolase [Amycolatopsis thermophila]|uniref:Pimeloyl-ACP methyl ester carboxylesterase n=1 Tax=Amycolatopsis thermophila TaxID=206084 RepID=A0ABU0EN81_9PSEU|nr:alpha/beta fold hydrolase [Amycolatopsis thermophila]MDQ0376751.1 pimeloyl-ACP methyl ester carboxylesterase [Amycolatopsis thermophila]
MERIETSSGTARWSRTGSGSPVVLMHGTPFSSFVWRDVAAALAGRHEVFAWDMPGYGRSEMRAGQDVSLAAQALVFTELLEHWSLESPSIVAHDFGGAVSLRAHLLHGARYRRLALVDVVAIAPWGTPFFRLVRENAAVFEQLPAHLHAALVREHVSTASGPGLRPQVLERLVSPWLGETGQAAFYRQIAQADERHTDEISPLLGSLDLPVQVCWGEADSWIPAAQGAELAARIPGATLRLLPGAGHLVQEDAPAPLTATLLDFLGQPQKVA